MTQKYIRLMVLSKYKLELQNFIEFSPCNKYVRCYNDFVELNIYIDKNKEETTKIRIASEITNLIINIIKKELLKENIKRICTKVCDEIVEDIYKHSLKFFYIKEGFIKDNIFNIVYEHIYKNNYINIDGFIKFRIKSCLNDINKICNKGIEEYLIKKNKDEFISSLRYFVEVQEERIDLLKIHILKNGSFVFYDKNDNILENDKDTTNIVIRENFNYEDLLISTLLTWCPREMVIYDDLENNLSKDIIETVKSIFDYRVIVKQRA